MIVSLVIFVVIALLFSSLLKDIVRDISRRKEKKAELNDSVIVPALNEIFDDVTFGADVHISEEVIKRSKMVGGYDRFHGNDYVRGTYNGLLVEMSDIHLQRREEYYEDKELKYQYITTFSGPWLICDFGKGLSSRLTLCARSRLALFKAFGNSDVEMENVEFNENYSVLTQNPHDAFYVLTPQMMEYILRTNEAAGGMMSLEFFPSGTVHIAINSGHNFFEPEKIWDETDLKAERRRIIGEIRYITNIIDKLRLTETFN